MSWTDDAELTEPTETDNKPLMGVTGGQRARDGDSYTLAFTSDGERVQTDAGKRFAADAKLLEASFTPLDGDGDAIDEGDEVRFMTGSSRFLAELQGHAPVGGSVFEVEVAGTGYNAAYNVSEVDGQ